MDSYKKRERHLGWMSITLGQVTFATRLLQQSRILNANRAAAATDARELSQGVCDGFAPDAQRVRDGLMTGVNGAGFEAVIPDQNPF